MGVSTEERRCGHRQLLVPAAFPLSVQSDCGLAARDAETSAILHESARDENACQEMPRPMTNCGCLHAGRPRERPACLGDLSGDRGIDVHHLRHPELQIGTPAHAKHPGPGRTHFSRLALDPSREHQRVVSELFRPRLGHRHRQVVVPAAVREREVMTVPTTTATIKTSTTIVTTTTAGVAAAHQREVMAVSRTEAPGFRVSGTDPDRPARSLASALGVQEAYFRTFPNVSQMLPKARTKSSKFVSG